RTLLIGSSVEKFYTRYALNTNVSCAFPWSACAIGKQDGDSVDDGIAALAAVATDEISIQHQGLATNGADEPAKVLLLKNVGGGWLDLVGHGQLPRLGARRQVPGWKCKVPWNRDDDG